MVCEDKDRKKPGKSYQKRLKFIIFGNYIHIYTYKRTFHVNIYINTKNERGCPKSRIAPFAIVYFGKKNYLTVAKKQTL